MISEQIVCMCVLEGELIPLVQRHLYTRLSCCEDFKPQRSRPKNNLEPDWAKPKADLGLTTCPEIWHII